MSRRVKIATSDGSDKYRDLTSEEEAAADADAIANAKAEEDYLKVKYKDDRALAYPSLGDFADAIYWKEKGDDSKMTAWVAACDKVKSDLPKS